MRAALPALLSTGATVFSNGAVQRWLNLAIGAAGDPKALAALDYQVKRFIGEGRDPTPDEWATMQH